MPDMREEKGKIVRKCNRCGELLPDEAFYKDEKCISGLQGRCKHCKEFGNALWTTEDELRHVRRLGSHARFTIGRVELLRAYLVIAGRRDWGIMNKEACLDLARELLEAETGPTHAG